MGNVELLFISPASRGNHQALIAAPLKNCPNEATLVYGGISCPAFLISVLNCVVNYNRKQLDKCRQVVLRCVSTADVTKSCDEAGERKMALFNDLFSWQCNNS